MVKTYTHNKIIDLTEQGRQSADFYKYFNSILGLGYITDKSDLIGMSTAQKILHSNSFIHKNLTKHMSETSAIRMVQLSANLAVLAWQWAIPGTSTWFAYYLSSNSGLRKMYECILINPLYGIIFYSTFYFKLLEGSFDEKVFNSIAKLFGFPKHSDAASTNVLNIITENTPRILLGREISGYKIPAKAVMKMIASGAIAGGIQAGIGFLLPQALEQSKTEITKLSNPAVYISERDMFDFDDLDIKEQLKFLKDEARNIKKYVKTQVNPKKKRSKKQVLMEVSQIKAPDGHVICLNHCKKRVKTTMGCYCESDCGASTFLGGKTWCWVDPEKCKNGKYLNKFQGRSYDYCDNSKISKTKKCYTGVKYTDCVRK